MVLGGQADHIANLFRRARQHHHVRAAFLKGTIVAVNRQILGADQNAVLSGYFFELGEDIFIDHFSSLIPLTFWGKAESDKE